MKNQRRLFFAIPFDSATKSIYKKICDKIKKKYSGITTIIGSLEVGPSPKYSDIASFKTQNRELTKQFVNQIQNADIIIADLTHNNPNVHVELGIALTENKNILRVTGRPVTELGFDIRNFEVVPYRDEISLFNIIAKYLDLFIKIKKLPISNEYPALYSKEPEPFLLDALEKDLLTKPTIPDNFTMRDGAIRAIFEFLQVKEDDHWFGILFRVSTFWQLGSILVYIRNTGIIDVAISPGLKIVQSFAMNKKLQGKQEVTIQFENNYLEINIGGFNFTTENLYYQVAGTINSSAYRANIRLHSFEMICRDTIEWK